MSSFDIDSPIRTLIVANRGEIARRIFRTCRDLGITTVAVHSDPDADAPFVREADLAVALGGASPAESYLRGDAIIAAAQRTGADAIHPGYGFLAEDARFARAVIAAGLRWIGPEPETIDAMGSKVRARELMEAAGVPVLPGRTLEGDPDDATLRSYADEIGYPLLVKASAGGGGRGMRRVEGPDGLAEAVGSARREADAAFGDGTVFLERYVTRPRHVEVQILGDRHGTVSALPERDCSIQRRHQKLIEESPAPAIGADVREALATAARDAARALRYVGAGTVEFVLAPNGEVFFLEVNTRLQVEHPVTELVCGLDLVALQIAVAEGSALPEIAVDPVAHGHAIEARIVAEDAAEGWRPQTGTVERFAFGAAGETRGTEGGGTSLTSGAEHGRGRGDDDGHGGPGLGGALGVPGQTTLRVDSAVDPGSVVSPHYDSMLAKVIVHAATRDGATRRLHAVLGRAEIAGIRTNRDLLVRTLESDEFRTVSHDTQLLDGPRLDALGAPLVDGDALRWAAAAAALAAQAARRADATIAPGLPSGWRNVPAAPQTVTYRVQGTDDVLVVGYRLGRTGGLAELAVDGARSTSDPSAGGFSSDGESVADGGSLDADLIEATADAVTLRADGVRRRFTVHAGDDAVWVGDGRGQVALVEQPRFPDPGDQAAAGSLDAPLPGTVLRVDVAEGDAVEVGQRLLVLEAMKMEHEVTALTAGTVTAVHVAVGDAVDGGQTLLVVDTDVQEDAA